MRSGKKSLDGPHQMDGIVDRTYLVVVCVSSLMPDVQIPEREERRLPRQCNSQKGKFITDSSQGSCRIQRSGAGSESPEPQLLYKFIGWA